MVKAPLAVGSLRGKRNEHFEVALRFIVASPLACGKLTAGARHQVDKAASDDGEHGGAVAEESLVHGDADLGACHLALAGLTAQLPGEFAEL